MPLASVLRGSGAGSRKGTGRSRKRSPDVKAKALCAPTKARPENDGNDGDSSDTGLPPLDVPPALPRWEATRRRQVDRVLRELRSYDISELFPRPQDKEHSTRHGFELHVRGEALGFLRRTLKQEVANGALPATARFPNVILLALLPVHIVAEGRLHRLHHTLRSIQQQAALPANCELIVAVSWYADSAFVGSVKELLAELVEGRTGPKEVPYAAASSRSHLERSIRTTCRPGWKWPRSQHRGRSQYRSVLVEEACQPGTADCEGYSLKVVRGTGPRALTVLVQQRERKTQFQHLRAALGAAEAALRDRWAFLPNEADKHSIWVIFGDDDDLWHPRRAAAHACAIQNHSLLAGVGVFVSLARANVERDEIVNGVLPTTAADVDDFLRDGRVTLNSEEKDSSAWLQERRESHRVSSLLVPDGLDLEHFDFCPRLRIFKEFFETVSPNMVRHRYCDLCLCEFLMRYNCMGRELGLEVCFMETESWLYFYGFRGVKEADLERAIEDDNEAAASPEGIGEGQHVSLQVSVETDDIKTAEGIWEEFKIHDDSMTLPKMRRYLAHFRSNMEMRLVRDHRRVVDQRDFDDLLVTSANSSFISYTDRIIADKNPDGETVMIEACRSYGWKIAVQLEVEVLWHRPGELLAGQRDTGALAPENSGGEEEGGLSERELAGEFDQPELSQVSSKVLAQWARHHPANSAIRSFLLESQWGEADALCFEDAFHLLRGADVSKEHLAGMFQDGSAGGNVTSRAVATLRKFVPPGEPDVLNFKALYRLLATLGFTPFTFASCFQEQKSHNEKGMEPGQATDQLPVLSGYRVLFEIGRGLAGSVFLCENVATAQKAAVKWPVDPHEVTVMKKIQEACDCPGFPKILGSGLHHDAPYFVQDLLGSSLVHVFDRISRDSLESRWVTVRLIGRMVLRRLKALHSCGYVHCDVATHNLLMGRSNAGLCFYLIDFGCARRFPNGGHVESTHGALEYSSVRSADGGERRPEEDLEALGWVMVNGLFGKLPWFEWLNELYDFKPSLQKIKRDSVIQRVKRAKASLLDEGWASLGPESAKMAPLPSELSRYFKLCRAPVPRLDYSACSALLGQEAVLDLKEAEAVDCRQLEDLIRQKGWSVGGCRSLSGP